MMARKFMAVAMMGTMLTLSACNTMRGAARDVTSVANCTQDMINRGQC